MTEKKVKITLVKSPIGASSSQRKVLEGLGLKKLHHAVLKPDNPQTGGAVNKIKHLVRVEHL